MEPIVLGPNQLRRFYRGGAAMSRFRGTPHEDEYGPEDWVGSTTSTWGSDGVGMTRLGDGRALADAIAEDPHTFLGPEHVRRFGPDPGVLVKLLDAGERLPVHLHPDRNFVRRHLGSHYGKTEAWVIVEAVSDAAVHVGFTDEVRMAELASWVMRQDTSSMLRALHRIPVAAGDTLFVPAGTPHAIGEGIFMVELQEPSDLSILLEWEGFEIDGPADGHLGLGFEVALDAVDRCAWSQDDLERLRRARAEARPRPGVELLFPPEADRFFRAERIRAAPAFLPEGFSIVVVTRGRGTLTSSRGERLDVARGATLLIPFAAGECVLEGSVEIVRCMPPSTDAVAV